MSIITWYTSKRVNKFDFEISATIDKFDFEISATAYEFPLSTTAWKGRNNLDFYIRKTVNNFNFKIGTAIDNFNFSPKSFSFAGTRFAINWIFGSLFHGFLNGGLFGFVAEQQRQNQ